jgi:hypothetical protein
MRKRIIKDVTKSDQKPQIHIPQERHFDKLQVTNFLQHYFQSGLMHFKAISFYLKKEIQLNIVRFFIDIFVK